MTESNDKVITAGELSIYPESYEVILNGDSVPLRPKEFEVLLYLVQRPGMVITRDDFMNVVWGFDYIGGQRTVDVHVAHFVRSWSSASNRFRSNRFAASATSSSCQKSSEHRSN